MISIKTRQLTPSPAYTYCKPAGLKTVAASMIILSTALISTPSYAQSNDTAFEDEVIVTARRKSESLQDVPGTVTAITAATIEQAGIQRAADFLALTPGVTLVDAAEVGDTQVNIRGINGARDAENSFAFLIDGVLYTNPAAFNREYTNLKQIEVFKGPQGAIYGRNAAAGAIIVTTETPGDEFTGNVTASYAEDDTLLLKGGVSGPLGNGNLAYGLSADYRSSDGFRRNSFQDNAPTVDAYEAFNLNGRLVYSPTDDFSLDVKARYGEVDASAIAFNSTFLLPNFAAANSLPQANLDVNDLDFLFQPNITSDNDQTALELSAKFDYALGDYDLTGWALYSDIENNLIADGTSGAFGFFAVDTTCQESVTALAGFPLPLPTFFGQDPDGVIFNPNGSFLGAYTPSTCDGIQEQLRDQSDFSAELRLASNYGGPIEWSVGGYFLDIDRQVGVSLNRDSGETPIRGLLQLDGPNQTVSLAHDDFDSTVLAAFGQVSYDVTDTLELSGALRYDSEKRQVSSLVPTDVTQGFIDLNFDGVFDDPLNPGLSPLFNTDGVIPDQEETFSQLQPKISASWDATPNTTLFANWGVGFKAGGFNNSGSAATVNGFINGLINGNAGLTTTDADGNRMDINGDPFPLTIDFFDTVGGTAPIIEDSFDKETSSAFELGFKSSLLEDRLKLAGAAYLTNVDDLQFFEFFVGSFGLLRVVSNVDEVQIKGFELGAELALADNMNVYGAFNLTDGEIKENASRPDTVGNDVPYAPDMTLNLGGDLTLPVHENFDLVLRGDLQYIGETHFHTVQEGNRATIFTSLFESGFGFGAGGLGATNLANTTRDGYTTIDLRAGFKADNWSLDVFADNVTNTEILEEVIPAPEFGGAFSAPGRKRRFGVELGYKF